MTKKTLNILSVDPFQKKKKKWIVERTCGNDMFWFWSSQWFLRNHQECLESITKKVYNCTLLGTICCQQELFCCNNLSLRKPKCSFLDHLFRFGSFYGADFLCLSVSSIRSSSYLLMRWVFHHIDLPCTLSFLTELGKIKSALWDKAKTT